MWIWDYSQGISFTKKLLLKTSSEVYQSLEWSRGVSTVSLRYGSPLEPFLKECERPSMASHKLMRPQVWVLRPLYQTFEVVCGTISKSVVSCSKWKRKWLFSQICGSFAKFAFVPQNHIPIPKRENTRLWGISLRRKLLEGVWWALWREESHSLRLNFRGSLFVSEDALDLLYWDESCWSTVFIFTGINEKQLLLVLNHQLTVMIIADLKNLLLLDLNQFDDIFGLLLTMFNGWVLSHELLWKFCEFLLSFVCNSQISL